MRFIVGCKIVIMMAVVLAVGGSAHAALHVVLEGGEDPLTTPGGYVYDDAHGLYWLRDLSRFDEMGYAIQQAAIEGYSTTIEGEEYSMWRMATRAELQDLWLEMAADIHAWYCDWTERNDVFYRSGVHSPTYHWVGCFAEDEIRFYAGWPKDEGAGSPTIIFAPWADPPNPNWTPSFQWPNEMAEDAVGAWVVCNGPTPHGTFLVDPAGGGDATTIQGGIDLAESGDTVELVDAVYDGSVAGNADLDFGGREITLQSQSGDPSACVIDCQGSAATPRRAFHFHSGETVAAVVREIGIRGGYATGEGGGILCTGGASPTLEGLVIQGCEAEGSGGAVACDDAAPALASCTLYGNAAPQGSGVACLGSANPTIDNSIIAFSTAGEAVSCDAGASAALACCDLYGNAGGDWVGCIATQFGQEGNFSDDPLFCDAPAGDLRIAIQSPCMPAANECGFLIGALGQGCSTGSVILVPETVGTIQEAMAMAAPGDTVLVSGGPYLEHDIPVAAGVTLLAATTRETVVIDAQGQGRALVCDNLAYPVHIEGFTITGGVASGASPNTRGGGLASFGTEIYLRACEFSANEAQQHGGGAYLTGGSITVEACDFFANAAASRGGALMITGCDAPIIVDCYFEGNTGVDYGGALHLQSGEPLVQGCTFFDNLCEVRGGAAACRTAEATFQECVFAGNISHSSGGALFFHMGTAPGALIACTLCGNHADEYSSAIHNQDNAITVDNTIITKGTGATPVFCIGGGVVVMSCSDVFDNQGGDYIECLTGLGGMNGNISADPLFCDEVGGDYRIDADSPCAEEHSGGCGTIGALPVGCGASDVPDETVVYGTGIRLYENRPNPFKGWTEIGFALPQRQHVLLQIFTPSGRLIQTLVRGELEAGHHVVTWSGRDDSMRATAASGAYFYRLQSGNKSVTRRMTLLR